MPERANYPPQLIGTAAAYQNAFDRGEPVEISETSDLRGRILRGRAASPEDFDSLGLPGRELVFTMGPDGLSELPGWPLSTALGRIGLTPDYVAGRVSQGYSFRLTIFQGGTEAPLATWDNALDQIAQSHPAVAADIEAQREALKCTPPSEFMERIFPEDFEQIELAGPSHPEFMTTARYLALPAGLRRNDPFYLRRWLIHTEHLGIAFRGDGYTQAPDGERGIKEYLMPNRRIASLLGAVVIDLPLDGKARIFQRSAGSGYIRRMG